MATVDVIKCCLDSIRQISDEIKDSIVYLDAGTTESFQFVGAFPLLMELGAQTICSLENPSSHDKVLGWNHNPLRARKIVAITSRFLSDAHRFILRCLSKLQNVHQCAIYTAMSEAAHSADPDSPLGPDAFREYESLLTQDYEELVRKHQKVPSLSGDSELQENTISEEGWSELTSIENEISELDGNSLKNLQKEDSTSSFHEGERQIFVVRVHHFPLIVCPLAPRVFVLPSEGSVAEACLSTDHEDSLSSGLPPLSTGKLADIEDISPGAALTAQFLYYFALKMDLKLEIFSLGDLSKNVGKLLTDMSSLYDVGRRKISAGILLIDRTLDLLTPCCHADSLVDRMLASLPRGQRQALLSQTKGSQSQLKNGPTKLERVPLFVQIPLEPIIKRDDSKSNLQLLENIEAFLSGWNINESDPQSVELMTSSKKVSDENCIADSGFLHGSFVSTDNFHGAPYLEAISERKTKDGAMLIKKWLQESLRRENISLNIRVRPGVPSKSELQQMIKALAKSQSSLMKNKGIIQLAAASLYAMEELHSTSWDAFISAEKVMYANAAETTQSLAAQISDLISKTALVSSLKHNAEEKSQGLFTLQGALLLTVIGYLLAGENFPTSGSGGPFSWQEEHNMKEAIVDAILDNPPVSELKFLQGLSEELQTNLNKSKSTEKKEDSFENPEPVAFDDDQWDNWGDDDEADKDTSKEQKYGDLQLKLELRDRVDNLFKFLHKLSDAKRNALGREGKSIVEAQFNDDPYSRKGLLSKLLTSILDKQEIPGMEYHSSTVGRLFKSGFGRFGLGQAKPSLADQNVILIFVIGGINGVEVREVQEALAASSKPDVDIILGGTTFLTPNDMTDLLLGRYSHM